MKIITILKTKSSATAGILFLIFFLYLPLTFAHTQTDARTILWIDSYHSGYPWSDSIERGITSSLRDSGVNLKIHRMNTKSCATDLCMEQAATLALSTIEEIQPDLIIASDDNAQKYLVFPYLKDTDMPILFCGVNWDASIYGYPTENITGMVEVDLIPETMEHLKRYAKGQRVGWISGDTASDRKNINWVNAKYFDGKMISYRVKTFEEFKTRFIQLQSEVDMMFIRNNAAIKDFDELTAIEFIKEHVKIPTASTNDWMAPYVVFTLGKLPEEQGQYAAETALKILQGARPADFPITVNKKAKMIANLEIAEASGITLPLSVLRIADVIGNPQQIGGDGKRQQEHNFAGIRAAWVDSYHKGYAWSDGIERAIRKVFFDTGIELTIMRMNSKRQNSPVEIESAAEKVLGQLRAIQPDIILASDDNAQKHLIVPHFLNSDVPVVFCGVNMDATEYGYPAANVTGMIEVNPVMELIQHMQQYSRGKRVGFIAGNTPTERRLTRIFMDKYFGENLQTYLVSTWDEFVQKYSLAQEQVDVLFFSNYSGIKGWNRQEALDFVRNNTTIPTGSDNPFMIEYVVSTIAKSAHEQGRFAATAALRILNGEKVSSIPIERNKEYSLMINLPLAQAAKLVIPVKILKKAKIVGN